jgi:hypothetical protein
MRKSFLDSIRFVLNAAEKCSTDNHGFVQYIHVSVFDNLRIEFEDYCRKHNVRPGKKVTLSQ